MIKSFYKKSNQRCNTNSGFSLIELMVSLSVFSIIMVTSIGTLLTMVDANAKAQALYSATTNLSFALENVTREIRMGYHYYCVTGMMTDLPSTNSTNNCGDPGGKSVSFMRERDDWQMGYRLNGSSIERRVNNPTGSSGDTGWERITSDDIVITELSFIAVNTSPFQGTLSDSKQPVIDMRVVGYVQNGLETETDFNIQTHIVQRRLDIW